MNRPGDLPLPGHQPLLLDKGDLGFRVIGGSVDLFLVFLDAQGRPGHRRPIASFAPGDVLFHAEPDGQPCGARFLAAGIPETLIRPVGESDIVPSDLDRWIEVLHERVLRIPVPRKCLFLEEATDPAGFSAGKGESVVVKSGVLWISHHSGASSFKGSGYTMVGGEDRWVPVSSRGPYQMHEDSILSIRPTEAVLRTGRLREALSPFHAEMLGILGALEKAELERESAKIKERLDLDSSVLRESLSDLTSVISSGGEAQAQPSDQGLFAACLLVCKAAGIDIRHPGLPAEAPPRLVSGGDQIEAIAERSHFRFRQVALYDRWWKNDNGPLLGFREKDGGPIALLPRSGRGYTYQDPLTGESGRVTSIAARELKPFAFVFYKPLPFKRLDLKDVFGFVLAQIRRSDLFSLVGIGLIVGLLSIIVPIVTGALFNTVIPEGLTNPLIFFGLVLVLSAVTSFTFQLARTSLGLRLRIRFGYSLEAALWDRLLRLSAPFFRQFTAGDLASRAASLSAIRQILADVVVGASLSVLFAFFSLGLLFSYSAALGGAALALALAFGGLVLSIGAAGLRYEERIQHLEGKIAGSLLQIILGVSKFRISGSEERAFGLWSRDFAEKRRHRFRAEGIANCFTVFASVFPVLCTMVFYALFVRLPGLGLSAGDFLAFLAAFGVLVQSLSSLSQTALSVMASVPLYRRSRPLLESIPEQKEAQADPGELRGEIECRHLRFQYTSSGPAVLRDVSLTLRSGEQVALVGPSGSGKSTLVRVILGLDQPTSGAVFFDGRNAALLDYNAIRRQIGVVLQSCQIMAGDIFSNIIGASVDLTLDDAWEAAGMAGLEQDVREMPMGMYTVLNEGGTTLSGGQRQRILIARALVRRPRVIIFDEATSALDNRTQDVVTQSLARLQATRLVVAHRLSSVRNADRIVVLSEGTVVQEGRFEDLVGTPGVFQELAQRQLL